MKPEINNEEPKSKVGTMLYAMLAFGIITFLFGLGVIGILLKLGVPDIIAGLASSQAALLLYFFTLYKFKFEEIKELFKWPKAWHYLLAFLAVISVLAFNYGTSFMLKVMNTDTKNVEEFTSNNAEALVDTGSTIALILFPLVIAPIVEELAFRAGLKSVLVDKGGWKPVYYVIISTVLFGLLHFQPGTPTIIPVLITGFLGLVNSLVYLKTKNIFIPIITHMLYNLVVVVLV